MTPISQPVSLFAKLRRADRRNAKSLRCLILGHSPITLSATCGYRDVPEGWPPERPSNGYCKGSLTWTACRHCPGLYSTLPDETAKHQHQWTRPLLTTVVTAPAGQTVEGGATTA